MRVRQNLWSWLGLRNLFAVRQNWLRTTAMVESSSPSGPHAGRFASPLPGTLDGLGAASNQDRIQAMEILTVPVANFQQKST